ncbi:MAG: carboxymuconolactone decarboxylase family protein [Deltaproteobacteria bacterium]|nr:carboxymuconolactone decarboxylase family protein [Deltaproteobacteria bacterium]MBW2723939.1 carboxymuconolactone decarboxylase family protein [Deltaproteobacteria bacterium]
MTTCRVELLSAEAAKKAAEEVDLPAPFTDLNVFRLLLHRPRTAKAVSDLLLSLLFGGELDDRLRELVIMRIGWATGSNYEWTQHWTIALERFGCSEEDLLSLRDWRAASCFGEVEQLILSSVDEILETGTLTKESFDRCLVQLGRDSTIELVAAVGTWSMISKLAKSLDIPLEEGVASWPPDGVASPSA